MSIFMDGPGGTGITFVCNILSQIVSIKGLLSINVASTGIAATLIPHGSTAHSRFKIPIQLS
jgi:PIF1-like helicase